MSTIGSAVLETKTQPGEEARQRKSLGAEIERLKAQLAAQRNQDD
ncbi:MAG: hypothetical protein AAF639_06105 [Chloroflexota bacterium]